MKRRWLIVMCFQLLVVKQRRGAGSQLSRDVELVQRPGKNFANRSGDGSVPRSLDSPTLLRCSIIAKPEDIQRLLSLRDLIFSSMYVCLTG